MFNVLLKILPILMLSLKLFSNKKLKYTLLAKVVLRVHVLAPEVPENSTLTIMQCLTEGLFLEATKLI